MATVFLALFGSIWESALFVPVVMFTLGSLRVQWWNFGAVVQWVVVFLCLCACIVRWVEVGNATDVEKEAFSVNAAFLYTCRGA
jgi:hypothetical protein